MDSSKDGTTFGLSVPLSEINEFIETTIVLKKDKNNQLGVSVVGGNDTYLETMCVECVHSDGVAYKDGRLKRGDILLMVNDQALRDVPRQEAVQMLRGAVSPVRLVVLRENPDVMFTFQDPPKRILTVELRKGTVNERIGLSLMQRRKNGNGVFVTWVEPGSVAHRNGRILQGDQILEINAQDMRMSSQVEVANILRQLEGALVLILGRIPSLTQSIQEWARRRVGSPGRIRTSTWSCTDQSKEKLQTQRPSISSLPTSTVKDKFLLPSLFRPLERKGTRSREPSPRRKGVVQGLRLTLTPEVVDEQQQQQQQQLPSIHVTGC